jgi:trimeric autotransporter adhesin
MYVISDDQTAPSWLPTGATWLPSGSIKVSKSLIFRGTLPVQPFNSVGHEQTLIEKFTGSGPPGWVPGGGPGWTLTSIRPKSLGAPMNSSTSVGGESPAISFPVGVWQQFVVRRSGGGVNSAGTVDLYYDGSLQQRAGLGMTVSSNPLLIDAREAGDGRNFTVDGLIDEVAISNRALRKH